MADPGFSPGGGPTPKLGLFYKFFAENCMKMKEFGPRGGASLAPPLDPPMPMMHLMLPSPPPPASAHTDACENIIFP